MTNTLAAVVLALAVVVGGFLAGGVYATDQADETGVWVVNKFTGAVWICGVASGDNKPRAGCFYASRPGEGSRVMAPDPERR